MRPSKKRTAAKENRVDGSLRRRKSVREFRQLAPRRNRRRVPQIFGRHQRPAHDSGRRRNSLTQRRIATDARPLRLSATGALVRRRAEPSEKTGRRRHGDLSREHRGHLRRHRMGGWLCGVAKDAGFHRERISEGFHEEFVSVRKRRATNSRAQPVSKDRPT